MKDYVLFTFMQVELKGICLVETGEGNGSPLQYACLENPVDGGAWYLPSTQLQRVGHD